MAEETQPQIDEETRLLLQAWSEEVAKYDRTVLALTTGAIGLSAALVRNVPDGGFDVPCLLLLGWLALVASLGLTVGSSVVSKLAIEARWDRNLELNEKRNKTAWGLSLAAGAGLFLGVLLLMVFAWLNVT